MFSTLKFTISSGNRNLPEDGLDALLPLGSVFLTELSSSSLQSEQY